MERAALGVPMAVCSATDNQVELSEDVSKAGYAIYLGDASDLTENNYYASLKSLLTKVRIICPQILKGFRKYAMGKVLKGYRSGF